MRRTGFLLAAAAVVALALAPGLAEARAGGGSSMGSRGGRTFSAPPATTTAPSTAAPMQRSMTPERAPSATAAAPMAGPAAATARSPFMAGLMGGLLGAGIGGLLFGGGLFHGLSGLGGFLGFLLQILLIVLVARFAIRWFMRSRQPAMAGGPNLYARTAAPQPMASGSAGPAPAAQSVGIGPADYQQFETLLKSVQAAWSAHDLATLRGMATPEMVSYFAEQMAEQASRGVRNTVTEVRLEQGDLSEAWAEGGRDYATVAMRFTMLDVTTDATGRVVEGDPQRRAQAVELWTFLRSAGGRWVLSAIQQAG